MFSTFTHRFVPARDATAPTLLLLHGTGGDENDLLPIARMIDPGAAVLSPRGRVLEHGMPRFFRRLAEGVFDLQDLARRTIELGDFVQEAAAQYGVDAGRVVAIGYSNGANIAASLLLTRATTLAGAILFRPMLPFEPEGPVDLHGKPILISAGRRDPLIPPDLTQRLADVFSLAGAAVTSSWYDTGHALTQADISDAAAWYARRIRGNDSSA
jgi:phospholipase/carboxylesterase